MAAHHPVARVLSWLRTGYPEGVPPKDFIPLVALLSRTLEPDELDEAVRLVITEHPGSLPDEAEVRSAIERAKSAPPVEADVHAVAARLASVGWPLAKPVGGNPIGDLVARVVAWLRAGYPDGIPPTDSLPLLALLSRRLTDEEVAAIAEQLVTDAGGRPISTTDAAVLITKAKDDVPSDEDLDRVRQRLAGEGWPLQG